jgi:hypothetical protein
MTAYLNPEENRGLVNHEQPPELVAPVEKSTASLVAETSLNFLCGAASLGWSATTGIASLGWFATKGTAHLGASAVCLAAQGTAYVGKVATNKLARIGIHNVLTMKPSTLAMIMGEKRLPQELLEEDVLIIPNFPKERRVEMKIKEEKLKKFSKHMPTVAHKLSSFIIKFIKVSYTDKEAVVSLLKKLLPESIAGSLDGLTLDEILDNKDIDIHSYINFFLLEAFSNLQDLLEGKGDSSTNKLLLPSLIQEFTTGFPEKLKAFTALSPEDRKNPEIIKEFLPKFSAGIEDPYAGRGEVYNDYIKAYLPGANEDPNVELTPEKYKQLLYKEFSRSLLSMLLPNRCDGIGEMPLHTREALFVLLQETILPAVLGSAGGSLSNPATIGLMLFNFFKSSNAAFKNRDESDEVTTGKDGAHKAARLPKTSDTSSVKGTDQALERLAKHLLPNLTAPLSFAAEGIANIGRYFGLETLEGSKNSINQQAMTLLQSADLKSILDGVFEGLVGSEDKEGTLDVLIRDGKMPDAPEYKPEELKEEMINFLENSLLSPFVLTSNKIKSTFKRCLNGLCGDKDYLERLSVQSKGDSKTHSLESISLFARAKLLLVPITALEAVGKAASITKAGYKFVALLSSEEKVKGACKVALENLHQIKGDIEALAFLVKGDLGRHSFKSVGISSVAKLIWVPIVAVNGYKYIDHIVRKISRVAVGICSSTKETLVESLKEDQYIGKKVINFLDKASDFFHGMTLRGHVESFMDAMQLIPEDNVLEAVTQEDVEANPTRVATEGNPSDKSPFLEFTIFHVLAAAATALSSKTGYSDLINRSTPPTVNVSATPIVLDKDEVGVLSSSSPVKAKPVSPKRRRNRKIAPMTDEMLVKMYRMQEINASEVHIN